MKKKRILLGLGAFAVLGLTTVLASCDGEKTYTVKFYNGSTEVASQTVTGGYNAKVPETTPTKEGSKFNGWYKDEALTTAFDFGSIIEGDTAVYAGWVNEFAVVFKDGTKTLSTQTVVNGFNAKVPTAPTSEGKVFNGWYEDAACQKAFNFGSTITKATTVYAGWVDQYTVTFKDGSRTVNTQTLTAGSMIEVPTLEEKSGKTFAGWFADALFTTAYDFANPVSSNTTIYAKWDSVYYTVSLMADANTKWKDISVEADDVLPTDLAPTKNYSVWDGKWYTDAACTQQFVSSTAIDGPITLYAGWNVETETVPYSFDYAPLLAAYPGKAKPTSIVRSSIFYLEPGMYFENSYANQTDSSKTNDPDFNTQKKAFWWSLKTGGKLSFDWKDRGSTTKFTIYRIPTVTDNSVVPTYTDADIVYNKATSGLTSHFEYDCEEPGTYIFVADGSIMVQQLTCTDVVEKSAPVSISVAGARDKFLVNSKFEASGLACTLNYANGSTEAISAATDASDDKTGFVVENVELKEEGTYTVTVTYTAHDKYGDYPFTATYDVNAYDVDSVEAFTYGIDSSRNTFYNQLVYAVGDTFTSKDISVHAYGEIGESKYDELLSAGYTVSEPDMTSTGMKEVTVTYDGNTTATPSKFNIQVVEKLFDDKSEDVVLYVNSTETVARKVEANQFAYKELEDNTKATYVFGTITEALQYLKLCKVSDDAQKILVLADGTYHEKVFIDMPNVTVTGTTGSTVNNGSNSGAIITFNAMNGIAAPNGNSYSTDGAASFTISKKATNCQVYNVTLMNDYNTHEEYVETTKITSGTQATAVLVRGDMAVFYNVSFSGYHDTLYADQGRQCYNNCYIEGRTDYIFGSTATAVFKDCTIKTLGAGLTEKNGGYVVATKGQEGQTFGYVFDHCQFTADENTQDGCVSIARGWDNYMTVMVMDCELGAHFSKGTYNQLYYEKTFADQDAFTAALEIGVYTYDATAEKYVKLAKDATLDSENQTYFMQFNDRYTKMNAIPHAELLFEYNNTGAGAIAYSEELAIKYKEATFTLMNPESEKDQATAADYTDFNKVFTAENGTVTYSVNWNPTGSVAAISVNGLTSSNFDSDKYSLSLSNTYVGNSLVSSQISSIKSAIKKALNSGYNLIGIYEDAEYTKEFTTETKLTSNTVVYARIIKGTLEVKSLIEYDGDSDSETTGWSLKTIVEDAETTATAASTMYVSTTPGTAVSTSTAEGLVAADAFGENVYLKSPVIADAVKEISVSIYGGTTGSGNGSKFILRAYDKDGNKVAEQEVYSTGGKKSGYFSIDATKNPNGNDATPLLTAEQIVLKSTTNDIAYYTVLNTDIKSGGTSKVGKTVAIASIKTSYEVITETPTQKVTDSYALDLTSESLTSVYAAKSGKTYLAIDTLPGNTWLTVHGKLANKSTGATENDLTSTAFYCAKAGTIDTVELDKSSNQNASTYEPGSLSFTTKGKAVLSVSFITNGGNAGSFNEVKLAVGSYSIADKKVTYNYLTAKTAVNCTGSAGVYTYDTAMTDKNTAVVTYEIEDAGTYHILNPGSRAVRISAISLQDTYEVEAAQDVVTNYTIDLSQATELGSYEGFTLTNTKDPKKITFGTQAVTFDGTTYNNYISTGGGCDSGNNIQFTVPEGSKGKLTAVITSGGGSARWAAVSKTLSKTAMDETLGYVNITEAKNDSWYYGNKLETVELEAGTYYLNYSNGVRIYYADLEITTRAQAPASSIDADTIVDPVTFVLGSNNTEFATFVAAQDPAAEASVMQGVSAKFGNFNIDASNGKVRINGGDNSQINTGTTITFKVTKGAKVTVEGYPGLFAYSLQGVEATEATSTYTATADNEVITIVATGDQYIKTIKVE